MGGAADLALGLAFVFFALASVASGALSLARRIGRSRQRQLHHAVTQLLDGTSPSESARTTEPARTTELYRRPGFLLAVTGGERLVLEHRRQPWWPGWRSSEEKRQAAYGPEWIDPKVFAREVVTLRRTDQIYDSLGLRAEDRRNGDDAERHVAAAFEQHMATVSKHFQDTSRAWLFALGLVLAIGINVDALAVGRTLWSDSAVRESLAAAVRECSPDDAESCLADTVEEARRDLVPHLGWPCPTNGSTDGAAEDSDHSCSVADRLRAALGWQTAGSIPGWILTAAAVSLGAPAWYALIRRVTSARPNTTASSSEDA